MIQIDVSQLRQLEQDLWSLSKKAAPYANTIALNRMAFQAQQGGKQILRDDFINRNRFTVGSVRVDKARGGPIGKSYSTVGSIAPYLADQEFGGTKGAKGGKGVPIATKEASGEGRGAGPRKRLPRPKNVLAAITLTRSGRASSKRQRNAIAVTTALRSGGGDVYLNLGTRRGLFRVRGTRKQARITMLHDLSHKTVTIHAKPWLYPAVRFAAMKGPEIYMIALQEQIQRQKLFRNR